MHIRLGIKWSLYLHVITATAVCGLLHRYGFDLNAIGGRVKATGNCPKVCAVHFVWEAGAYRLSMHFPYLRALACVSMGETAVVLTVVNLTHS